MGVTDTIAAISTPPGEGGIGVVRISGDLATEIGERILRHLSGKPVSSWPERFVRVGMVVDSNGDLLDQVVFFLFKKPRSYTGEDILEIQGHGGEENLKLILSATLKAGARLAEPGEFTKRAFLNGRMDLSQAEAVIDLIRAQTDIAQRAAFAQLSGKLSALLHNLEEDLMRILVPLEAALDYPEDEIPDFDRKEASIKIDEVKRMIADLISQADKGRILREAATIVLAGRPNVGKSSILNRLLGEERAIVTPIPGTTRDFVAEIINLDGIPVRLVDTAGLREIDDPVEKEGVLRSWQLMEKAEIILFILDSAEEISAEEKEFVSKLKDKKVIFILNKSDLPTKTSPQDLSFVFPGTPVMTVSTLTGAGMEEMKKRLREELIGEEISREHPVLVTRLRHKKALEKAMEYLNLVAEGLKKNFTEDLIAIDLRAALEALGEITGRTVSAEIIENIFSQFCVGK